MPAKLCLRVICRKTVVTLVMLKANSWEGSWPFFSFPNNTVNFSEASYIYIHY